MNESKTCIIGDPIGERQPFYPPESQMMPRWKCHKEVFAFKIKEITPVEMMGDDPGAQLISENGMAYPVSVAYLSKHHPWVGGYFVLYPGDNYESFSPAKAFEEGYTRIEQ